MTVVLTAKDSPDNTFNCYEPPTVPRLLTIASLSNIAFMGHCCVSLLALTVAASEPNATMTRNRRASRVNSCTADEGDA